jgi:MYXO-CTERM domain-containing protein
MRRALALAVAAALLAAPAAAAHQGNPNYRSVVDSVTPIVKGLTLHVLDYDDRFELTNHSGETVTVQGYDGEPYARVLADGSVEVNKRSPAYYLNDDRFADVKVPASADPKAPPRWSVVDRTGRLEWHDHRMHWMSRSLPPQVEDTSKRTKVFDYAIPLRVGDRRAGIRGTLFWQPDDGGGAPVGMFIGLGALALLAVGAVLVVRRRRAREPLERAEAW